MEWKIKKIKWRLWLRALHRDIGYLIVGLTVIYASSGLAINHVADWNPNFRVVTKEYALDLPPKQSTRETVVAVLASASIKKSPEEVEYDVVGPGVLEVSIGKRFLNVDLEAGVVIEEKEDSRFFLRVANWLHENRGKAAWTYIADLYAILLLYLAFSGLFMLRGKKGLWGRGGVLVISGAAVPVLYVVLSGGPP